MKALSSALSTTLMKACDEPPTLTAAQKKELLKLALASVKQTRRSPSMQEHVPEIWPSTVWQNFQTKLAVTERFKASKALHSIAKQISQAITGANIATKPRKSGAIDAMPIKRKAVEGVDSGGKEKIKRKRPKKEKD